MDRVSGARNFFIEVGCGPACRASPKEVPVTAQLQATYHGDARTLDVAGLNLATRAIRVNATGSLGSENAQAHVSVNATDLRELQPALDALDPGTRIPVTLEGRSSFNGVIFGRLDALSMRGHLELEKFDTEFHLASQPKGRTKHASANTLGRALGRPDILALLAVSAARNVAPGSSAIGIFCQHYLAPGQLRRKHQPAQCQSSYPE